MGRDRPPCDPDFATNRQLPTGPEHYRVRHYGDSNTRLMCIRSWRKKHEGAPPGLNWKSRENAGNSREFSHLTKKFPRNRAFYLILLPLLCLAISAPAADPQPVAPTASASLFNGKDLTGLTPWLRKTKREDPQRVFRVTHGQIHITGDDFGYLASNKAYRDYRVVVEYRWGKKTDGGKYVRNSGILLHATGPDGGANGTWMSSIECQLAQGCVGDLIVIRGKDAKGETIPVSITSDIVLGPDKRPRWKEGGEKRVFPNRQLWWNNHDPDFKELLDTRGKNDIESPLGEWTRVECTCDKDTITIAVNGKVVNKAYDVTPAAGRILLQSEGFELYVRKFEIQPAK